MSKKRILDEEYSFIAEGELFSLFGKQSDSPSLQTYHFLPEADQTFKRNSSSKGEKKQTLEKSATSFEITDGLVQIRDVELSAYLINNHQQDSPPINSNGLVLSHEKCSQVENSLEKSQALDEPHQNLVFEALNRLIGRQENVMEPVLPQDSGSSSSQSQDDEDFRIQRRRIHRNFIAIMSGRHWTKYFLVNFKAPVFKWLEREIGFEAILRNLILRSIKEKKGISRRDYIAMFRIRELRNVWKKCFKSQFLYREMMCGKAELASKLVNTKFANIFERVFVTGRFPYIAGPPTYQSSRR